MVEIDLYSPTYMQQQPVYSTGLLDDTTHIISINYIDTKNPASTGYMVTVDAFDVMGILVSP